jgi:hypothetical protein
MARRDAQSIVLLFHLCKAADDPLIFHGCDHMLYKDMSLLLKKLVIKDR